MSEKATCHSDVPRETVPCPRCNDTGLCRVPGLVRAKAPCPDCFGRRRVPARHSDAALDAIVDKVRRA